jgi:hypothetical protein
LRALRGSCDWRRVGRESRLRVLNPQRLGNRCIQAVVL